MNIRIKLIVGILLVIGLTLAEKYYTYSSKPSTSYTMDEEYNNSSITGSTPNEETTGGVCDICGKHFTGRGYEEVSEGVWEETKEPYQSFVCSRECGLKHTSSWEKLVGKKRDGRIYEKEPCGLCNGTGIEEVHNSLGDVRRVCPMCHGKGYENY